MRKLTNPWPYQKDAARRAEYVDEARENLAEIAALPLSAVLVKTTDAYRFYRVIGTAPNGRPISIVSEMAQAAYDGKRVRMPAGSDVVDSPQGWYLRVHLDGTSGRQHVQRILSHLIGPGPYDITEF